MSHPAAPGKPFPSAQPLGEAAKKKKRARPGEVYSQPADTGTGAHVNTQLVYAVEYLKSRNGPARIEDIAVLTNIPLDTNPALRERFAKHERVTFVEKTGLYEYKHEYNIRNKAALLTEIQRETRRGGGFSVKVLKESWPAAPAALDELERDGDVFITRTTRDSAPKMVYWNETRLPPAEAVAPSAAGLINETGFAVEQEFCDLWHGLTLPNDVDLLRELEHGGLQATASDAPAVKGPAGKKKGRKAAPRQRVAKMTNTHLKGSGIDLTKDYVPAGK